MMEILCYWCDVVFTEENKVNIVDMLRRVSRLVKLNTKRQIVMEA